MVEFLFLGPVEAAADGSRAALHGRRQPTILAVLLAAGGRTVTTDRLIDALWGEAPRPAPANPCRAISPASGVLWRSSLLTPPAAPTSS